MKWTKEEIQRVRDISIANEMGVKHKRRTNIICPLASHHDKTASFLIDENNGFYCFGCGAKGSGFIDFCTLILEEDGVPEKDIFPMIMDDYCDTVN